jgi:hypothetical protein
MNCFSSSLIIGTGRAPGIKTIRLLSDLDISMPLPIRAKNHVTKENEGVRKRISGQADGVVVEHDGLLRGMNRKAAGGMPDHMVSKTAGNLADVTGPRGGVQIARMVRRVCRVFCVMVISA